jgi:outer membrane protein
MTKLAALLLLCSTAHADFRCAYLDTRQVMEESSAGRAIKDKLTKEAARRQKELDAEVAAFEAARAEFDKQRPMLNASAVDQKQRDLTGKLSLLQERRLKLEGELSRQQQELLTPLIHRMESVVAKIAEREHFAMVFDRTMLIFGRRALDITPEVLRALN